jgi:hypothetical protein
MLYRLQVVAGSVDSRSRTFQARGGAPEMDGNEAQRLAKELESGAVARFYRGAPPTGRVVAARATADGVWLKIRINPRQADPWRLVESGAVSTVEIQTLDAGVDLFLKSSPSTYPSLTS